VVSQRADEFLHGFESAAHDSGAPLVQEPSSPPRAVVLPEGVEGFLEEVGPGGSEIIAHDVGEFIELAVGEIFQALEETVAGVFEQRFVTLLVEGFDFIAADLVDGFAELFDDVKAIEDVEGFWKLFLDDLEVGLPHVGADGLDLGAPVLAEVVKEAQEGFDSASIDDAEQASLAFIDLVDEGHVVVAFAVGDFVDSEGLDALEIPVFEAESDDPGDRAKDDVPRGVKALGHLFPTQKAGPASQEMAHGVAAGVFAIGPRHLFDGDSTIGTIDSAHGIAKEDTDIPQRHEAKESEAQPVVSRARLATFRAPGFAVGPWLNINDQGWLNLIADSGPPAISVNKAFDRVEFVE